MALAGFSSIAAQIVLLREFLIVFYGNEISISFIFVSWFASGFLGSWLLGVLSERLNFRITVFSLCQFSLSILLPVSILLVRSIKIFLGLGPGEIIAFFPMLAFNFIILLPICALFGFMFALGAKIYAGDKPDAEVKIATVYILEATGSILAGLLVGFILIRSLDSLQIMVILSLTNLFGAILLQKYAQETKFKTALGSVFIFVFLVFILGWAFSGWQRLQDASLRRQWRGYRLLAARNSIYGNIVAAKIDTQYSFFYNGLHLYSYPEQLIAEESVHLALLEHARPKSILLVGGGIGGLIREILKHPVERVDYIELDPLVMEIGKEYLPQEESNYLKDARVKLQHLDARFFIKQAQNKYDCIVMHLGAPQTAQLNRYYTVEFFQEARRILKQDGILSFSLTSSESYISLPLRNLLSSVYYSLKKVFAHVLVMPGETAYFFATAKPGVLTYDYNILDERAKERALDIKYVRPYYLFAKLSPEKVQYIEEVLNAQKSIRLNYDFQPAALNYNMIFLAAHFRDSFLKQVLSAANERNIFGFFLAVCIFIILSALTVKNRKRSQTRIVITAVLATGFTQMSFQMLVLLCFQIIYGYLFYQLGLLVTSFMVGLTLGSLWMIFKMPRMKRDLNYFIGLEVAVCLYPLLLVLLLYFFTALNRSTGSWLGPGPVFSLLPAIAGFLGGAQFPLANKICLHKTNQEVGRVAGLTYGMDLLGSCLGAFLTAVFFIPILGIAKTCLAAVLVNLSVLLGLLLSKQFQSK
jgi:spermidine synthase